MVLVLISPKFFQPMSWFCRLMRRFFRRWLIGDLRGNHWLSPLRTGYKTRFVPFIFTYLAACQIASYYWHHQFISGYCDILFVIGQSLSCLHRLSRSWVSRDNGRFVFSSISYNSL